jgi:hypothetical protein
MDAAHDTTPSHDEALLPDDYDERPIEGVHELDELMQLRAELSWADWKAHPRFKKDRVIREAQRRLGTSRGGSAFPALPPANDVHAASDDDGTVLAHDADFEAFCNARRDGWIDALDDTDTHD